MSFYYYKPIKWPLKTVEAIEVQTFYIGVFLREPFYPIHHYWHWLLSLAAPLPRVLGPGREVATTKEDQSYYIAQSRTA